MDSFLTAIRKEVSATRAARETIKQTSVIAKEEYNQVIEQAHAVVGSSVPCRKQSLSNLQKQKQAQTQKPVVRKRSLPQDTIAPERHVSFDLQSSRTLPRSLK